MCYVARVVMRNDIIFIIAYIRCITQYEIFIKNTYEYSLELFTGTFGIESVIRERGGSRNLPYLIANHGKFRYRAHMREH